MRGTASVKQHWLFRPKPNAGAGVRLFCFPYAGGSAAIFRTWPEHLPNAVEVCAIVLPGRAQRLRERPHTRVDSLVCELTQLLAPELTVPFAFYGHSMGALLSFELARELCRRGLPTPLHLFVSAHRAPHLCAKEEHLHNLPEARFISELKRRYGSAADPLEHEELRRLMMPCIRADMEACETYMHASEEPLHCPITVFGGEQDSQIPAQHLTTWRQHTTAACSVRLFPGDHFFLHQNEQAVVGAVLEGLRHTHGAG